uniref:Uncharacterized protein n=1 Tax=Rhodopseudomonas palustris (strain BisA53) TaxID=316055 RepID=Q07P72_RHOP5
MSSRTTDAKPAGSWDAPHLGCNIGLSFDGTDLVSRGRGLTVAFRPIVNAAADRRKALVLAWLLAPSSGRARRWRLADWLP